MSPSELSESEKKAKLRELFQEIENPGVSCVTKKGVRSFIFL